MTFLELVIVLPSTMDVLQPFLYIRHFMRAIADYKFNFLPQSFFLDS
jgi:hypothetical protein